MIVNVPRWETISRPVPPSSPRDGRWRSRSASWAYNQLIDYLEERESHDSAVIEPHESDSPYDAIKTQTDGVRAVYGNRWACRFACGYETWIGLRERLRECGLGYTLHGSDSAYGLRWVEVRGLHVPCVLPEASKPVIPSPDSYGGAYERSAAEFLCGRGAPRRADHNPNPLVRRAANWLGKFVTQPPPSDYGGVNRLVIDKAPKIVSGSVMSDWYYGDVESVVVGRPAMQESYQVDAIEPLEFTVYARASIGGMLRHLYIPVTYVPWASEAFVVRRAR